MKKVVILVVLLVLAAGGVLGGMAMMGMGPLAKYVAVAPDTPKAEAPPPPSARLMDMETIGVPIIEGSTVTRRYYLNLQLDVVPERAEQVKALLPRLQSAFLQEMLVYLPKHLRERDKLDPTLLQQHLLLTARKVAGGRVRGVMVKNFVEQH